MPVTKHWSIYRNARPISKAMEVPWQDTTAYRPGTANSLTAASTCIVHEMEIPIDCNEAKLTFGWYKFTYYVEFRG